MGAVFAMSIPGLVLLLFVLAVGERVWRRIRPRDDRPMLSATAFDELTAMVHGTKRIELEQRQTTLVLGEDEESGAPPRGPVDLDSGTVRLRPGQAGPGQLGPGQVGPK